MTVGPRGKVQRSVINTLTPLQAPTKAASALDPDEENGKKSIDPRVGFADPR